MVSNTQNIDEKEQQHIAHMLVNAAPVALAYVNKDQCYEFVNETFARLVANSPASMIQKPILEIEPFKSQKELEVHIERALMGEASLFEFVHGDEDSEDNDLFLQATYTPNINEAMSEVEGFYICLEDVTDLKEAQKKLEAHAMEVEFQNMALQAANREAQKNTELKGQFLANITHELRTPMNGVIGMAGILLGQDIQDDHKESVQIIKNSAENLLELINDILDFTKIESGKLELETTAFEIRPVVREVLDLLSTRVEEKEVDLLAFVKSDVPAVIKADVTRIRQILYNLLGNALKFTDHGHVAVTVQRGDVDNQEWLIINVEDTGIGIPKDKHKRVFDMFNQADTSTTRKFGGTGLGLSICSQLAHIMGGEILLDSEPGRGSTFSLKIPLEHESEPPAVEVIRDNLKGKRALIIDDNEIEAALLSSYLKHQLVRVHTVSEELEAQRLLESQEEFFDLIFVDDKLSGASGVEVAKRLKDRNHHDDTQFILISNKLTREQHDQLVDAGIDAHIDRPVWENRLVQMLNRLVQKEDDMESMSDDDLIALLEQKAENNSGKAIGVSVVQQNTEFLVEGKRVLVAEDNSVNQIVITKMLEQVGCDVTMVANGEEAVTMLQQMPFDIVLMDCQMPVMDGFEATKAIRDLQESKKLAPIQIVAVTANASKNDRRACLDAGMDNYISKPIDKDTLHMMLGEMLTHPIKAAS